MATNYMNTMMTNREIAVAVFVAPFLAIGRAFTAVGQASANVAQLEKLRAMSDEDLAARGVTRAQAAQQILRCYY